MITPDLLQAAVGCTAELAARFAPYLDSACGHYRIDSQARLAAFLAQVGHESGSFRYVRELADGAAYEGRADLGNTHLGDGPAFRGRGLIQITGRHNYSETTKRLRKLGGPDFETQPELLEEPRWAAWSAADWWAAHGLNELADSGEFDKITRRINGGTNGQADRRSRWERAKAALAPYLATTVDAPAVADPGKPQARSQTEWDLQNPAPVPQPKAPMAPFIIPAAVELAKLIPRLGTMFGGSEVAQRNVAAASVVVDAVTAAVGASNAQQAVEKIQADPAAREQATKAVEGVWYQISETGSGGIDGARKADAVATASGEPVWRSPSFVMGCLLLPLVYLIIGNVAGLYGAEWSPEARAGIAGSLAGGIVMGLIGYYFGQTTSRNRTPAP